MCEEAPSSNSHCHIAVSARSHRFPFMRVKWKANVVINTSILAETYLVCSFIVNAMDTFVSLYMI